ncbi:DUF368 domain-containing protein [Candidatus Woesearchaeota archaeon]|nr:DUF368 domain-containing protein [Nanoarchaeota archaeon]MCB9370641.1 DUF368 domain-containing protein [Candidatus Woesearchaeota archaeon]USN43725.1 MAG: DUF368 domain-containing protein [Candidatus Woesearchaeota archaeon]
MVSSFGKKSQKKESELSFSLYLKGFLMGLCDLVPGISGGTIAFITGIYERLVRAVHNISPVNVYEFFLAFFSRDWKKCKEILQSRFDIFFLLILFAGIGTAIFTGAKVVEYLLLTYEEYVLTFFVGLILASSKAIYDETGRQHNKVNLSFFAFGFVLGLLLLFLSPSQGASVSLLYVFLGGFLAISAMFLPGISGSFILLIMGLYETVLSAVNHVASEYVILLAFALGAVCGVFVISRVITWLFEHYRFQTLYLLLGLVLGCIFIPLSSIVRDFVFSVGSVLLLLFLVLLGMGSVFAVKKFA